METENVKNEPKEEVEEKELYRKTTLKDLKNELPILPYVNKEPVKNRTFTFIEWNFDVEEKLSDLKSNAETPGLFVNSMLCLLLDSFCGEDFQSFTETEKRIKISNLEFSNVMYIYMYLRVEELGDALHMAISCPNCKYLDKDWKGSLYDLDVHVKDECHKRVLDYELKKPISYEDKIVTNIIFDHSKWSSLERAKRELAENAGKMKKLFFVSSLIGASEAKGAISAFVPAELLRGMHKFDIERGMAKVTENNAGPVVALSGTCKKCGIDWLKQIDWTFDSFFDSSSL